MESQRRSGPSMQCDGQERCRTRSPMCNHDIQRSALLYNMHQRSVMQEHCCALMSIVCNENDCVRIGKSWTTPPEQRVCTEQATEAKRLAWQAHRESMRRVAYRSGSWSGS